MLGTDLSTGANLTLETSADQASDGHMTNHDERQAQQMYVTTTALLKGLANLAEDAGVDDLALYLAAARDELADGPWALAAVNVDSDLMTLAAGVGGVLSALDDLRALTTDEVGIVAIAAARLWVVDGIRHLDRVAERFARQAAELRRSRSVDWRWAS